LGYNKSTLKKNKEIAIDDSMEVDQEVNAEIAKYRFHVSSLESRTES
jgi:hypothetical protein